MLESDNGLVLKTKAIVQMNADNATAFANRKVPHTVIYQNGAKGGLGANDEIEAIAQTQMMKNLKALDYDLTVKKSK